MSEEKTEEKVETKEEAPQSTVETQKELVEKTSQFDETYGKLEEKKVKEEPGALIPVTVRNVNLTVNFRLPGGVSEERLVELTQTLDKMRKTFGEHVLIEELTQLVYGKVESIAIQGNVAPVFQQPTQPLRTGSAPMPVQVPVPAAPQIQPGTGGTILGHYAILSDCPWKGMMLQTLNPADVYRILTTPEKRAVLHPQDVSMMEAYYMEWQKKQAAKPVTAVQQNIPLHDDQIPYNI